ncbi:MAG: hypothetical protein ACK53L_03945, partial [Pirellulaceae bacterium]
MLFEARLAIGLRLLFKPGEAKFMSGQTADDVVIAIAVDIVGMHLGAATGMGKAGWVVAPARLRSIGGGLFKPAARPKDI